MNDSLKDFIQNHKLNFDDQQPAEANWEKIVQKIDKSAETQKEAKVLPLSNNWFSQIKTLRIAAAGLLFMVGVLAIFTISQQNKLSQIAQGQTNTNKNNLKDISPELSQAEAYYTQLISEKETELKKLDPQEANYCTMDLQALNKEYDDLKKQLLLDANNEQLTDAMIRNLQIRMQILNRQLKTLQKLKNTQQDTSPDKTPKTTL